VHDHRQPIAALEVDARTHGFERLLHPHHRAAGEAVVADEAGAEAVSGDHPGHEAGRRSAVPAVEIRRGRQEPAAASPVNAGLPIAPLDASA
jgi:hypothetical protein